MKRMRDEGIKGINVTIPHKHLVMKFLDRIDRAAAVIGAVNTVVNKNGKLTGYNTDYLGFLQSLKKSGVGHEREKSGNARCGRGRARHRLRPEYFWA